MRRAQLSPSISLAPSPSATSTSTSRSWRLAPHRFARGGAPLLAMLATVGACEAPGPGDEASTTTAGVTRTPANFPATTATLDVTLPPLTAAEQAVLAFGARTSLRIDDRARTTGLAASAGTVVVGPQSKSAGPSGVSSR